MAADWSCSLAGQSWHFPLTAFPTVLALRPGVPGVGGYNQWSPEQQARASGREGTTVVVCASLFLIPCVESVAALEF